MAPDIFLYVRTVCANAFWSQIFHVGTPPLKRENSEYPQPTEMQNPWQIEGSSSSWIFSSRASLSIAVGNDARYGPFGHSPLLHRPPRFFPPFLSFPALWDSVRTPQRRARERKRSIINVSERASFLFACEEHTYLSWRRTSPHRVLHIYVSSFLYMRRAA